MAISISGFVNRYKRIIIEGLWVVTGQALRAVGMLVGIRLLTSYVAPAVYGKLSLLMGVLVLGTGIFCGPFLHAANRFYHEAHRTNNLSALRHEIKKLLIYSTVVLSAVILSAGSVYAVSSQPSAMITTIFLTLLLGAQTVCAYETNFLTASRHQARYSAWVSTESWIKPFAALLLIWVWQPSVDAILVGYLVGTGIAFLVFYRRTNDTQYKGLFNDLAKQSKLARSIFSFAVPLIPLALIGWISSLGDRYIIGGMLDFNAVGVYAAAYGIVFQPFNIAGGIVELTLRPIYFEAVSNRELERGKTAFRLWLLISASVSAVGVVLVSAYHNWIAVLFLGREFRHASDLMPWIAAGGGLLVVSHVLEKPFYAYMKTRYVLYAQLWGAIVSLVLCLILIPLYGLKGAAVAVPIYCGAQCLITFYLNRRAIISQC